MPAHKGGDIRKFIRQNPDLEYEIELLAKEIVDKLKEAIDNQYLNYNHLSKLSHVNQSYISKIVNHNILPRFHTIITLFHVLGYRVEFNVVKK